MVELYAPPPKPEACYASLKDLKYQLNKGTELPQDVLDFVEMSDPKWMKSFYKAHPNYHPLVVESNTYDGAIHSLASDSHDNIGIHDGTHVGTHDGMLDSMISLVGDLAKMH